MWVWFIVLDMFTEQHVAVDRVAHSDHSRNTKSSHTSLTFVCLLAPVKLHFTFIPVQTQ